MKICTNCGRTLDESEFYKLHKGKGKLRAQCKSCALGYVRQYYSIGTLAGRFHRIRGGARSRGIDFAIDLEVFVGWFRLQRMNCHYCGSPLTKTNGHKSQLTDWTFDRKDNKKGYSLNNIVLCCRRCNMAKGSWFTETQMLEIATKYFKKE